MTSRGLTATPNLLIQPMKSCTTTRPRLDVAQDRQRHPHVPLVERLWSMMRLRKQLGGPNPHNLVWSYRTGQAVSPRDDYKLWQALPVEAGVRADDDQPIALHAARHTMSMIGHSVVTRRYHHVDPTLARSAMPSLSELLA